jgi:hypothetical protein
MGDDTINGVVKIRLAGAQAGTVNQSTSLPRIFLDKSLLPFAYRGETCNGWLNGLG